MSEVVSAISDRQVAAAMTGCASATRHRGIAAVAARLIVDDTVRQGVAVSAGGCMSVNLRFR